MSSLNSLSKWDEAHPRAHVFQTLVPPMSSINSSSKRYKSPLRARVVSSMSSPMSSLNIPNSRKAEIESQHTERLPSPPPLLPGVEPTIFRWPETMAHNLSSQTPATAQTQLNRNYQQFPATNDLVDRAQIHRANNPADPAQLTKANCSLNRALSRPISTNRILVDPRNLVDYEFFERLHDQTNFAFRQANSSFNQAMSSIPDIDKVIRETQQTPFSFKIANTCHLNAMYLKWYIVKTISSEVSLPPQTTSRLDLPSLESQQHPSIWHLCYSRVRAELLKAACSLTRHQATVTACPIALDPNVSRETQAVCIMIRNQAASTVPSRHARNTICCDKINVTLHGKPSLPQSRIRNTSYQQPGKQ
ncbi:unnamed protein product [Microthlaspi erraticum]|uniref:Uncharacterized protein n=1 Tax=Microthlaspi erraticum TaxID=1685480 RepID=A0A6D2KRX9_9BRAS|nr:unnamed protein product [Microthlaspi erraticum]CAA7056053.1 unnamed protein product [Microthlaspi erraticum]